jgi:hypothetical protein
MSYLWCGLGVASLLLVDDLRRINLPCIQVNKGKRKGRGCYAPARVVQPPKPGHIAQTLNAIGFAYVT